MKKKKDESKKEDEGKKGIVESFLGGIPLFGDFFKELAKTETFKEKFREVNEKIEENLRVGGKTYNVEANISVRPLSLRPSARSIISPIKPDTSELAIGKDYFYGKKGSKLTVAVKVPEEDADLSINHKTLLIKSEDFEKKIELPDYYRSITKKQYKDGILVIELTK